MTETNEQDRAQITKLRLRMALAEGYTLVKGLARAISLTEATIEQRMAERIEELVGPSRNPRRPSQLERVQNIRKELRDTITEIRNMTPEQLALMNDTEASTDAISSADPVE